MIINKIKYFSVLVILMFFLIPVLSFAQNQETTDQTFKAVVIKILDEKTKENEKGIEFVQQNLKLRGLEGEFRDQDVEYIGIGNVEVASAITYSLGDKVLVNKTIDGQGNTIYYVVDYVRVGSLLWLAVLFLFVILIVGGFKGFKALLGLIVSFAVILYMIVPWVISGRDPLIIGVFGSLLILLAIIYLTEGWNKKSHIAVFSIAVSLAVTLILSYIFTFLAKLTGMADPETVYIINEAGKSINFRALFLTGVMIGTLGVLDDVVVGQIEAVAQIKEANRQIKDGLLFKSAMKVGKSHLGAIVNTLFLAYAGVSLPLLILFYLQQGKYNSYWQAVNTELVSAEIIRTLVGIIGLALAVPIATFIASKLIKANAKNKSLP